jgi:hypothetical protein
MIKPTSRLMAQVIEFVRNDPSIRDLLDARDNDSRTSGAEITCRYLGLAPRNVAEFQVNFQYNAPDSKERTDDVAITVGVLPKNPPEFLIKKGGIETY